MIDTIGLQLKDNCITDQCDLKEAHSYASVKTGEIKMSNRFFFNSDDNLIRLTKNRYGVFLFSEVPRWKNKDNIHPLTSDEFYQYALEYQNTLYKYGIDTNLWKAKICRMDLFQDREMQYDPKVYYPILKQIAPGLLKLHEENNGILFRNSQREIGFYNKTICPKCKNRSIRDLPENYLRCELRFKKHQAVQRYFPSIHDFQSLLNYHKQLPEEFYNVIKKEFFAFDSEPDDDISLAHDPEVLLRNCFVKKSGRGVFNDFQFAISTPFLLNHFKTFENIKAWLLRNFNSSTAYSILNKMKGAYKIYNSFNPESNPLIKELTNKFCDPKYQDMRSVANV